MAVKFPVHTVFVLLLVFFLLLIPAANLQAQYTTGTVQGTVFDPSGAVVPNATVKLHSLNTNVTRTFTTGTNGIYTFPAVVPGSYEVTAIAQGFSQVTTRFAAVASQTVTEDLKVGVQGTTETVEVQGEGGAILDKTDAQVSQNYDAIEVNDLPTNHSASGLVGYAPGVQPMYSPRGGSLVKLSGAQTGQISANGGRAEYGNVELDFTDANDWEFGGFALGTTPDPSFVQEFKVLTSDVPAEYGIKSNGEIEMITKSGTNNWHGEVNDYLQNNFFNARNYNDKTGKPTRTDTNNYGFDMGGPLQKDKTWLFGGWRQFRNIGAGATYDANVPTPAAVATVTDPGIQSIISQYLPTPTIPTANPLVGIFPVNYSSPGKGYQFLLRGDHQFSPGNSLAIRYFQSTANTVLPFVGSLVGLANEGSLITAESRNANITDTWTINAATVNQLRVAYARSVGILPPQDTNPGPYFTVAGLITFGEYGGFPQGRVFDIYQANDILSHTLGKHQLKFGFDSRIIQDNSYNTGTGQFFTRGYFIFPSETAFLNAQPSSYFQLFGPSEEPFRTKVFSAFAEDEYHILPTLTLNLGLRWEYQGALNVANNNFSLLDLSVPGAIGNAGTGPLGSFRVGNPIVHPNPLNMAPRFGFAWNPGAGNLVVRGGYGIYFDTFDFTPLADQGRTSPPVAYNAALTDFTGGNTISALLAGNAPFQQAMQQQVASGGFGNLTNFGSVTTMNAHMRNPYMQEYDLGLQYRIGSSMIVGASYIGSKGTHLAAFIPVNPFNPSLVPAPATSLADQTARLSQFKAVAAQEGTGALRLDPRFSQVNYITDAATSIYNSLQLTMNKDFSHGLMFQAAYTYGRSIDDASTAYPVQDYLGDGIPQYPGNIRLSRAPSNFDMTHRFLLTGIYRLPFFANRKDRISKELLGGWEFESTQVYQSGVPINVFAGPEQGITDVNMDGSGTGGNAVDNTLANCSIGGTGLRLPSGFSSKYTYSQPLLGNEGTCGRNSARLPGLLNFNWGLMKSFSLAESGPLGSGPWALQLRVEAYNVFNTPSFYVASVNNLYVSNPVTFGQTTPLPQRHLELMARITW